MIVAAEIAGYLAAHAIWNVSDGPGSMPMLAYSMADGSKQMVGLAHDDLDAAIQRGKDQLATNEMDALDAVLAYDGTITVKGESCDAVVLELRTYSSPDAVLVLGVPYTPSTPGPFAVHNPKLLIKEHLEDFDTEAFFESFLNGAESHADGWKVWMEAVEKNR